MNRYARKRVNNQSPISHEEVDIPSCGMTSQICRASKGCNQKDARLPNATLPSLILIPYCVSGSGRHYKVMTPGHLIIVRTSYKSLHGTCHICDLLQSLCWKKMGIRAPASDINEIMTMKSMHRRCVPMCSPNISLSSEYRGQLCALPMEGRQKCCVFP